MENKHILLPSFLDEYEEFIIYECVKCQQLFWFQARKIAPPEFAPKDCDQSNG